MATSRFQRRMEWAMAGDKAVVYFQQNSVMDADIKTMHVCRINFHNLEEYRITKK
jgi:hypothetical protein